MLTRILKALKAIAILSPSVLLCWTSIIFLLSVLNLQNAVAFAFILLVPFYLGMAFSKITKDLAIAKKIWKS